MAAKFKVGDRVTIVSKPTECIFTWVSGMDKYCGCTTVVKKVCYDYKKEAYVYRLECDHENYSWCENCFEEKGEGSDMNMFGAFEFGMNKDKNIASTMMGVAVKHDGHWRIFDKEKCVMTDLGAFKPGDFPLYLIPTKKPLVGDLIKHGSKYLYITEVSETGAVKGIFADTGCVEEIVPVKNVLGMQFFTKVVSMIEGVMHEHKDMKKVMLLSACAGEGKDAMNQLLPMLAFADKGDGADFDEKKLMKLAVISSCTHGDDPNSMLLPLLMDLL